MSEPAADAPPRENPLQKFIDAPEVDLGDFLECALLKMVNAQTLLEMQGYDSREFELASEKIREALFWYQHGEVLVEQARIAGPRLITGVHPSVDLGASSPGGIIT
jgi:hypothetical protein